MLAYLFTAIFMSLLWAVVLALDLPLVIAIAPTAAVVLTVAALVAVRKLQARKAARELEKALASQGEEQAKSARPDQHAEVQAMQEEFNKAVSSLKSSKLARGGSDALSVLPWYVIIGPPGAGKSTALRNSGLQFPYLSTRGGGVRGVGGTRNCEWWLTNEAVILDTAGRYTTEEDDRDEWFAFLDTVAKHRARKPINGLIAAVSVGELLDADEEGAAQLGKKMRERIDEVMTRLKVILPVYVLFTKADLISGFVETFSGLHKSERSQIWGFTVPLGQKLAAPGELFRERFDELVGILEGRSLKRLGQERRQQTREKVYQFPIQFASLRANLSELIQNLFLENIYQDTPLMRGVYFTSGTQEGRPIDRLMLAIADGFGIRPSLGDGVEPAVEAKSYFLGEVFSQVMFKDQSLAVRSTAEAKRQGALRYVYAGGALALALLLLSFPTLSFFENRALVQSTRERIAAVKLDKASMADPAWLKTLAPLRERVEALLKHEEEGPPVSMRLGMYQGGRLLPQAKAVYAAAVRAALVGKVSDADLAEMSAFAETQEGYDGSTVRREHVAYYDKLKLHLLLSGPKAPGEPSIGDAERQWAAGRLVDRWAEVLEQEPSPELQAALDGHTQLYLRLLTDPALLLPRSEPLVKRLRGVLSGLPWETLALEKLIVETAETHPDLTLKGVLGGGAAALRSSGRVRGAFTRRAWEDAVRARLAGPVESSEAWVLAREGKAAAADDAQARALRAAYFQAYIQEWRGFLESIRVEPPADNAATLAMLEDFTRGKLPPLARIFQLVGSNVRLSPGEVGALKAAAADKLTSMVKAKGKDLLKKAKLGKVDLGGGEDKETDLTAKDVELAFVGFTRFGVAPKAAEGETPEALPLEVYQEQLEFLRDAMRADMENPEDHGPLLTKLQTARLRVRSLIDEQDVGWRPRIEALLWPPLEGASKSSANEAAAMAAQRWCSAIVAPFEASFLKFYPFNAGSVHDAPLTEVADFYRPEKGTLWAYYESSLKNDVLFDGNHYKWSTRFGGASKTIYNESLLRFLERSRELSQAIFPKGAAEITAPFTVMVRPSPKVSAISFTVDGKTIEYKNGPEQQHAFVWPGEGKPKGARLLVRTNQGQREEYAGPGEWGLFHLLEQSTIEPPAPGSRAFTATWKMRSLGAEVSIVFEPSRESPFFGNLAAGGKPELLRPFRGPNVKAPRAVGRNGGGCAG